MKLCLVCKSSSVLPNWQCGGCGFEPERRNGFVAFAPLLADENDGFAAASHDSLDKLQDGSFWFRARNKLIGDLVKRFFADARNIFEIGCGTGYVLQQLRFEVPLAKLTGSEIHLSGLSHAARRVDNADHLFQMDARVIPFLDEFDLICAFDVLEHIDEDAATLREIWRSLLPGGGVFLSVPQHPSLWSRSDEFAYHKRRYRRGELEMKCQVAGFKVIYSTSYVLSLLPLMAYQRMTKGRKDGYDPSSEMKLPHWLDKAFESVLDVERLLISAGLRLPIGGSRFVIARKQFSDPRI